MTFILEGNGPYDLPLAQKAHAMAGSDTVTLSFRVHLSPNQPVTIRIAVPNSQALELAHQIAQAAADKA